MWISHASEDELQFRYAIDHVWQTISMTNTALPATFAEEIRSVCRTTVGDELRSITYFDNENDVEQVYLRSDLEQTADLVGFADLERMGFHSQAAYKHTQLGEYKGTIRMFENGFLTRVIGEKAGVWVTTDDMSMERFEELVVALGAVISEIEQSTH